MFSPTKLKEKRESQGLSQSQLASSLGISRASYFNWESGKTKPNQNNLSKLSEILNVDPRYFESEYEIVETYLKLTERNQEATLHYATELLNKQNAKVVEIPIIRANSGCVKSCVLRKDFMFFPIMANSFIFIIQL
ncbi:transcriptional regulator [Streptococcus pneumoniae]|nr:transcriptional regulator [Streptococcus pneumoniae]